MPSESVFVNQAVRCSFSPELAEHENYSKLTIANILVARVGGGGGLPPFHHIFPPLFLINVWYICDVFHLYTAPLFNIC